MWEVVEVGGGAGGGDDIEADLGASLHVLDGRGDMYIHLYICI